MSVYWRSSFLRLAAGWCVVFLLVVCALAPGSSTAERDATNTFTSTTSQAMTSSSASFVDDVEEGRSRYPAYLPWAVPCSGNIAEQANCPASKPLCCTRTSAVRCCPIPSSKKNVSIFSTVALSSLSPSQNVSQLPEAIQYFMISNACSSSCGDEPVRGFEFTQASLFISVLILFILFLFGSVLSSAMGKYSAFLLERNALLKIIRQRRRQERAASKAYRAQLEQFMREQERIQQEDASRAAAAVGTEAAEEQTQREGEATEGAAAHNNEGVEEEEILCVICYVRQVDVAVGPCGHVAVCRFCCQRLRECPVCREPVKSVYALPPYLVRRLAQHRRAEDAEGGASSGVAAAIVTAALDAATASASLLRQGGRSVENMYSLPVPGSPTEVPGGEGAKKKKNSAKYERLPSTDDWISNSAEEGERSDNLPPQTLVDTIDMGVETNEVPIDT